MISRIRHSIIQVALVGALIFGVDATAAPPPTAKNPPGKNAGMQRAGPMVPGVLRVDDATKQRGGAASGGTDEAIIFHQPNDSGLGWFMKSDDVFGYSTWASQSIFANGFGPGDSVSAYEMTFYHSALDDESYGDATVMTELWDGDPFSIMDVICTTAGVSAPIPGTQVTFSGIPYDTVARLRAELPAKVNVGCDRVWIAMTLVDGCHGAWRIAGMNGDMGNVPAQVGEQNGQWLLWACEQFGDCNTATGYNSGTCCAFGPGDPNEGCDHASLDGGGDFRDPCATEAAAGSTFCGDGEGDYFLADVNDPGVFKGYVSTVYAVTDTVVQLVPVSVDAPPGAGGASTGVISLSGNDLVLSEGDHNVWLEFRIGDWDRTDSGDRLDSWHMHLDPTTLKSGDQGELTAYTAGGAGTCAGGSAGDPDCAALLGPGGLCDPTAYYKTSQFGSGYCSYLFIDESRPDYVYSPALGTIDPRISLRMDTERVSPIGTIGLVFGRGPDDPVPFPEGGLYVATLTLHVTADARGTFSVGVEDVQMSNQFFQSIPLIGVRPARITVQTGRCCFDIDSPEGSSCLDSLMTAGDCAEMPGATAFTPNASCSDVDACPNPPGRCCFNIGAAGGSSCVDTSVTEDSCTQMPGLTEFAEFATCSAADACPNPSGRCCLENGCDDTLMTAETCASLPGTTSFEPSTTCPDAPVCPGTSGRCCFTDGCIDQDLTAETCAQRPGISLFDLGASCSETDACSALYGRCCSNIGSPEGTDCDEPMTAEECAEMPGLTSFELAGSCTVTNACFDCGTIAAPAEPAPETHAVAGNSRYLSFVPPEPGVETALQVTFIDSDRYPVAAGMSWWVGEPSVYCENGAHATPPCPPVAGIPSSTFLSSNLQCEPHCMDFGSLGGVLHVGDSNIVPGSRYEVRAISCGDGAIDRTSCSESLPIATSVYADAILSCEECPCAPPDGEVNIIDCKAVVDRFVSASCAPITARVDLEPGVPDRQINIIDVLQCVIVGFPQGVFYDFSQPERCK